MKSRTPETMAMAEKELDKFIENHNSKERILSNKILFKNFINNFFMTYAG